MMGGFWGDPRGLALLCVLSCTRTIDSRTIEEEFGSRGDSVQLPHPRATYVHHPPTTTADHGTRQIEWVRSKGGFVHDAFEIRKSDTLKIDSMYGVFAKRDIAQSELVLVIPRDCLVQSEDVDEDEEGDICETVFSLAREMQLGNESQYEPYISYLNSQPYGQLPTMWTEAGKEALLQLLALNETTRDQLLPPLDPLDAGHDCQITSVFEKNAEMLVRQRSWDHIMIPVWDMVSHRNGNWTNLEEKYSVFDEQYNVIVQASRDIKAGEELFMSYDHCKDCGNRVTGYGTADILRDYGFVESFPQKWIFHLQGVVVGLDYPHDDDGSIATADESGLILTWYPESQNPDDDDLAFFQEQVQRLKKLDLSDKPSSIPQHEWDVIVGYGSAIRVAMERILDDVASETRPGIGIDWVERQVNWVSEQGGFVNSNIEIRRTDPNDPSSRLGVFAKRDIVPTELIFSVPGECIISPPVPPEQVYLLGDLPCHTARALGRELIHGVRSKYAPYINFLKKAQEYGYAPIPSAFSDPGKELLSVVLGTYGGVQILPPESVDAWIDDDWIGLCQGGDHPLELLAASLTVQHQYEGKLVPLVNLIRHRRGSWTNTDVDIDDSFNVIAGSRLIKAGEELFLHYGDYSDTTMLFRDVGVVESFPQAWEFPSWNVSFELDLKYTQDGSMSESDPNPVLTWDTNPASEKALLFLEEQLERLEELGETALRNRPDNVPRQEWDLVIEYHQAMIVALSRSVEVGHGADKCLENQEKGTCPLSSERYNLLDTPYGFEDYDGETCDPVISLDLRSYDILETIQTPYQKMLYIMDPVTKNVCFDLDAIYQICSSYRPHYHEYVVHYTARFLPKIKRVLWVGGGDSMLLHEILKYPSLEFVIGLELDQKVTRGAFKYFGSQPHWDNEKVQWWYGDAAKSLLMLPKDYFGTFDMVLVDLSETVMSNTVTKGLDIMGALSLLLKPDGIFVKNEMYFEQNSQIFQHTLQLHYDDVPLICSQCLILSSNKVDFVNVPLTDHGVDVLFSPLKKLDHDFGAVRDYMHNPFADTRCKGKDDEDDTISERQDTSSGILLILEAEDTRVELAQSAEVEKAIVSALAEVKLTVVSVKTSEIKNIGSATVVLLREGYVVARTWAKEKYCAFDIHLWSTFHSMEITKKALLTAVGSTSPSSFRIIAGGMHGLKRWAVGYEEIGPKFTLECDEPKEPNQKSTLPEEKVVEIVIDESLGSLLVNRGARVVVLCGSRVEKCKILDVIGQNKMVRNVIPLWACPGINKGSEFQANKTNAMYSCELETFAALKTGQGRVDAIVIDQSAPFEMAQIVRKLASRIKNKRELLSETLVVLAPVLSVDEGWRMIFVDNFRLFYNKEPAFASRVFFNSKIGDSVEVSMFSAGDKLFITHVREAAARIEERTSLFADIRHIGGVKFTMQENFEPSEFFLPSDYDQSGPYAQWSSQRPVGHQTLVQLGLKDGILDQDRVKYMAAEALVAMEIDEAPYEFDGLGDGCVVVATWSGGRVAGGSLIVLWDGKSHVSLNLFTYRESVDFAGDFVQKFANCNNPSLEVILHEDMPRGHGRVVNFLSDINERRDPNWAIGMKK